MSDEELDREWKPAKLRPQSTMARSFSLALDDLFKIDNSIADLDAAVSEKKMQVTSQTSELEALEARLKAAEERLKAAAGGSETSPTHRRSGGSSPRSRVPLGDTFAEAQREQPTSPLSEATKSPSRPQTATRPKTRDGRPTTGRRPTESYSQAPPMPGALPPTPGASEGESESLSESEPEYVLVDKQRMNPSADLNPAAEDGDDLPPAPPAKDA